MKTKTFTKWFNLPVFLFSFSIQAGIAAVFFSFFALLRTNDLLIFEILFLSGVALIALGYFFRKKALCQ